MLAGLVGFGVSLAYLWKRTGDLFFIALGKLCGGTFVNAVGTMVSESFDIASDVAACYSVLADKDLIAYHMPYIVVTAMAVSIGLVSLGVHGYITRKLLQFAVTDTAVVAPLDGLPMRPTKMLQRKEVSDFRKRLKKLKFELFGDLATVSLYTVFHCWSADACCVSMCVSM